MSIDPGIFAEKFQIVSFNLLWNGRDLRDVAAYLQSGDLQYQVSLTGSLPAGDVVVDVEACAEATVRLEYLQ